MTTIMVDDISRATPDVRSSSAHVPEIISLLSSITPPLAYHAHSWATLFDLHQVPSQTRPSPASHAHLAHPPVSNCNTRPTQVNISGDLTKPSIRPPSQRPGQSEQTDAVPSLLGPDIAERAQAVSEATHPTWIKLFHHPPDTPVKQCSAGGQAWAGGEEKSEGRRESTFQE